MEKKLRKVVVSSFFVVIGVSGFLIFNHRKENSDDITQKTNVENLEIEQEKTIIHADIIEIPFEEGVLDSDLVVRVTILGVDSELETDLQTFIPKTVHNAEIIETYNGKLKIGDKIRIMQDGTTDALVNGLPIFDKDSSFIFMLDSAMPKEEFPNTYFIKKQYLLSETTNQVLDLNFGDSTFEDIGKSDDPEINTKMEKISNQATIDEDSISVINEKELISKIEEVLANEED